MRTKITKDGYVIIPSKIRKQLRIGPNTTLEWVVEGATARVIPIPADLFGRFEVLVKKAW